MPSDKLSSYREKRDPAATPEPLGEEPAKEAGATRTGAFVVHLHDATRRHYDLRIEAGGALASFAVPKGPGLDPTDKQLAIRTEDHPIEYLDFEAVIPDGNYGAGPMICWDRGMIRYEGSTGEEGLAAGKLDFMLSGYKLRGRYALVKLPESEKGNEWLLIKKNDAFAKSGEDIREAQPRSVLSGLTVDELEKAPELARVATALAKELGAPTGEVDGKALSPMLCSSLDDRGATSLPESLKSGYTYELKLDGVRVIADKRGHDVHLTYRSNRDTTIAYPEVERALQTLAVERVVLDGEIVAFDDKGLPNFQRLAQRIHTAGTSWGALAVPVVYLVFDVLALGPYDVRGLSLAARREILKRVVPGAGVLRVLDHLETGGDALLDFCRARHMEGIVCKKADAPYREGPKRTNDWVKVKCERDESFVVIGWTRGNEGRSRLGALDLGGYEDGKLVVRGKVGSGLDEKMIDQLLEMMQPLVTKERLFAGKLDAAPNGRTFVEPKIVVSVRYLGWSDEGRLRFPTFRGIDYDRAPTDCLAGPHTMDAHLPSLEAPRYKDSVPVSSRSPYSQRRAVLTNQDKVFWPPESGGYTKGDLCKYYEAVSTVLLPHLRDRPVVLVRHPDGIEGKSFFQWNVPHGFPAWVPHIPLDPKEGSEASKRRVFLVNDLESLLVIANLGAIPLHVLACRSATQQSCDFCTIDFDVGRSTLKNGIRLALTLKDLLERLGLRGYPKTSGQKGLHVLIPMGPGVTFETAQALNTLLGRLVTAQHPDIATMERVVEKRGDKVLVDIGQTGRHRTIVAPYSVRAYPGATVSTPLRWDELTDALDPSRFTIRTVPQRIATVGDLARGVLDDTPDIRAAIGKLEAFAR